MAETLHVTTVRTPFRNWQGATGHARSPSSLSFQTRHTDTRSHKPEARSFFRKENRSAGRATSLTATLGFETHCSSGETEEDEEARDPPLVSSTVSTVIGNRVKELCLRCHTRSSQSDTD